MRTRRVLTAALGATTAAILAASAAGSAAADAPAPGSTVSVTATATATGTGTGTSTAIGATGPALLILTVAPTGPNATTTERTVTLACGDAQPAGDHPDAVAACADLLVAQGDLGALPPSRTFCPELYLPVTATADGFWNGQPIVYQQTFTNECSLHRATGRVFAF
ncbi:subtilase-type protease inhibitor [Kitasatospora sp. NBC_01287]|uniref:SSI family serine proteinase inhibitor n=1 Tax=Kitasatospora sp. NBC_01287 TaxID=2903573 RepID=UPI0022545738|nr:SSI family serine proteinase inhibitor [Kitasatospora sp. NBC_01287]MCX4744127.1 subtilase-type protease inhibitor [Kitasatospora sp. NBC_01287]